MKEMHTQLIKMPQLLCIMLYKAKLFSLQVKETFRPSLKNSVPSGIES